MARVLIVVPPLAGHVNPLVGVAAELTRRGHDVTWAGSPRVVRAAVGAPVPVRAAGPDPDGPIPGRPPELRAFAALRHLWERFLVPLADEMLPGVDAAVRSIRPDLVLADQQAMAGPLAAVRHGVPWVTSASTSAELGDPFAALPRIGEWIAGLQASLGDRAGVPIAGDLRFSPHLVLAFTVAELAGTPAAAAGPVRFVGPSVLRRPETGDFPWSRLDGARPLAVVTLGTANAETARRFLDVAHETFRRLADEVQAVLVDPAGTRTAQPGGPLVLPWIPQLAVLSGARLAVCHGGHNTVVEALSCGVPLVVAPIRDDQPVVAGQVVDAGAGVRVRYDRAGVDELTVAIRSMLDDPAYAASAAAVAAALAAAGGPAAAAAAVEDVLDGTGGRCRVAPGGRGLAGRPRS